VLGFVQQEWKRRCWHTWWLLVAGEWLYEDLEAAAVGRSSARGTERACMRGEREKEKAVDGCLVKIVLLVFCLDLNAIFCSDMVIRGS
jgi:hypothetical protein